MWPFKKQKEEVPVERKVITQQVLGGRVLQRFTALEDFTCDVTGSVYVKGAKYNIREGNPLLIERVASWLEQNKVEL